MIIGHERQIGYLDRVIARGRIGHAYLFYGPDRVGKAAIAQAAARLLLCPNARGATLRDAGDGCAVCAAADAGMHRDLVLISRGRGLVSDKGNRKEIPIEDIRELKRRFAYAPAGGAWRLAIVDGADTMSQEAADAFLKLLEEPGERTVFFLIAPSRESVTPTIVSRAILIGFSRVPDTVLGPYLARHVADRDMSAALASSAGRPGVAVALAEDPARLAEEKKRAQAFAAFLADGVSGGLLLSKAAGEDAELRLDTLWRIAAASRHLLARAATPGERLRIAARAGRMLDLAETMATTNVNPRLALDVILLNYLALQKEA